MMVIIMSYFRLPNTFIVHYSMAEPRQAIKYRTKWTNKYSV